MEDLILFSCLIVSSSWPDHFIHLFGNLVSVPSGGTTPCHYGEEVWQDGSSLRTTIRAENEVEANKLANNYRFGFRKWKSHVTERPIEDRSDIVRELYSELNFVRPQGSLITCGNIAYLILFGWWISLAYLLVCVLMFLTIIGVPYGKLCWKLSCYFLWPFGKSILKVTVMTVLFHIFPHYVCARAFVCVCMCVCACLLACLVSCAVPCWVQCRVSTYVWLLLGYPLLGLIHSLACFLSWILVFTIPVAKMNARTLAIILLMPPEDVHIHRLKKVDDQVLLCCYHAFNWYYYKYTLDGINVFAVNLLPLVITTLVVGYVDTENQFVSSEAKFAAAVSSIIPLSYYIGMGIASISAQSNFAVGAVVNATFGSITEMTFYITALLRGHKAGTKCYEEIVKAALTGTLLGCILFIPGISMIIGGFKHREQRFNSRSAGVSSALLFISVGGVFAPTLFSKAYGSLVCAGCSSSQANTSGPFTCMDCHYDMVSTYISCSPLVYTISVLLPSAYLIGLIFTLKTHSHIYDIQVSDTGTGMCDTSLYWFLMLRALSVLIMATLLMAACADLTTEHIKPILDHSSISQYFIGVTVLAMVPEIPEIFNGIQFALQNNISLSLEVGNCIAVQVCMIQIPLLILFNTFYDVGFVLLFSDLHLWASIFSVIVVNYIFMDGKSDYFQGTALVVVYLILLALYFFAPSPHTC
uniref:Cation/H+ exchanger protein 1 n=1 Tax=Oncorhynchus kisutch TaxID=8019 RepID=A0A8C7JK27_ONCKI